MTLIVSYLDTLGAKFPTVKARSLGRGVNYEDIIWEGGDSLPSQATLDAYRFTYTQEVMWELIKSERDRRREFGGYKVGNDWFHSDDISRIQQLGLVMLGANMPPNIMWKTMGGSFVPMTPSLAQQIFQAAMVSDSTIFQIAEQKKAAMLAMPDPENYNYLSGWPLCFGE